MGENRDTLERLYETIKSRKGGDPAVSHTAKLFAKGRAKIAQKMGEEAVETAIAAVAKNSDEVVAESADLLYHLLVVLKAEGVPLSEVMGELDARTAQSSLAEKAARKDTL